MRHGWYYCKARFPTVLLMNVTFDEWLEISRNLEVHHAIFHRFWQMGRPVFTDKVGGRKLDTAAVQFNANGDYIDFLFNPDFWKELDLYNKLFVIAHECLHVILNHGIRTLDATDHHATNATLDVVDNHALINRFGFDRAKIMNAKNLCWIDTVFKNHPDLKNIPEDESFEYYYKMLPEQIMDVVILDDHSTLNKEDSEEIVSRMNESLPVEEKESIQPFIENNYGSGSQAWTGTGSWTFVNVEKQGAKRKWETVIKKWSLKYLKHDAQDKEQWAIPHRRYVELPGNMFLPSEIEEESYKKDRLPVFLFLDTSGSCYGYKERFFKAGLSLPKDRFDVRLFCFDTRVMETTLESRKIYGGGGTAFHIIEAHIQRLRANEGIPYPEAVFIITDGGGDDVRPQYPNKWFWFLTPHNSMHFIPQESKKFNLKDFE